MRRVTSRHVARVHDSGDDESGVWLVTELVEGAPLTVATLGRPLLPHEVLRVARGLLEGLAAVLTPSGPSSIDAIVIARRFRPIVPAPGEEQCQARRLAPLRLNSPMRIF